jgi:protein-tyrosine phosphatase
VIDLHSHVLPGLDDGAPDLDASVALGRAAADRGTKMLAATPHIREDHVFPLGAIEERAAVVREALGRAGVELELVTGGEVALTKVVDLDDETLRSLCLGSGPYMLVETPYTYAPEILERVLVDLQERGFRPILAHPERSPAFLHDLARLQRLAEQGVLCSVTALSMRGAFGGAVRDFTVQLFSNGLVHDVASDAHNESGRPPGLREGFYDMDAELPGLADQADWFTVEAPAAILAGEDLPAAPQPPARAKRGIRKLLSGIAERTG